jgi:hypothetical protein
MTSNRWQFDVTGSHPTCQSVVTVLEQAVFLTAYSPSASVTILQFGQLFVHVSGRCVTLAVYHESSRSAKFRGRQKKTS